MVQSYCTRDRRPLAELGVDILGSKHRRGHRSNSALNRRPRDSETKLLDEADSMGKLGALTNLISLLGDRLPAALARRLAAGQKPRDWPSLRKKPPVSPTSTHVQRPGNQGVQEAATLVPEALDGPEFDLGVFSSGLSFSIITRASALRTFHR
eukprot:scaffold10884_cov135-Isochrysis_galbana.AAC.4